MPGLTHFIVTASELHDHGDENLAMTNGGRP